MSAGLPNVPSLDVGRAHSCPCYVHDWCLLYIGFANALLGEDRDELAHQFLCERGTRSLDPLLLLCCSARAARTTRPTMSGCGANQAKHIVRTSCSLRRRMRSSRVSLGAASARLRAASGMSSS